MRQPQEKKTYGLHPVVLKGQHLLLQEELELSAEQLLSSLREKKVTINDFDIAKTTINSRPKKEKEKEKEGSSNSKKKNAQPITQINAEVTYKNFIAAVANSNHEIWVWLKSAEGKIYPAYYNPGKIESDSEDDNSVVAKNEAIHIIYCGGNEFHTVTAKAAPFFWSLAVPHYYLQSTTIHQSIAKNSAPPCPDISLHRLIIALDELIFWLRSTGHYGGLKGYVGTKHVGWKGLVPKYRKEITEARAKIIVLLEQAIIALSTVQQQQLAGWLLKQGNNVAAKKEHFALYQKNLLRLIKVFNLLRGLSQCGKNKTSGIAPAAELLMKVKKDVHFRDVGGNYYYEHKKMRAGKRIKREKRHFTDYDIRVLKFEANKYVPYVEMMETDINVGRDNKKTWTLRVSKSIVAAGAAAGIAYMYDYLINWIFLESSSAGIDVPVALLMFLIVFSKLGYLTDHLLQKKFLRTGIENSQPQALSSEPSAPKLQKPIIHRRSNSSSDGEISESEENSTSINKSSQGTSIDDLKEHSSSCSSEGEQEGEEEQEKEAETVRETEEYNSDEEKQETITSSSASKLGIIDVPERSLSLEDQIKKITLWSHQLALQQFEKNNVSLLEGAHKVTISLKQVMRVGTVTEIIVDHENVKHSPVKDRLLALNGMVNEIEHELSQKTGAIKALHNATLASLNNEITEINTAIENSADENELHNLIDPLSDHLTTFKETLSAPASNYFSFWPTSAPQAVEGDVELGREEEQPLLTSSTSSYSS